jgi:hypothetical protein
MPFLRRNEISWNERFRRCLYFFLRDELDSLLINEALIGSYHTIRGKKRDYPFVEMRELKPKARIVEPEYPDHGHFIVMFIENTLPHSAKTHIRFLDDNKLTKENLGNFGLFDLQDLFRQRTRFFEDSAFPLVLKELMRTDFALLIQRDPSIKTRYRFGISHFHVRIDWPVAQAAEDLGRYLRYLSRDLYEKGEKTGDVLQQKVYEYYGFHHMVGGRRTAAVLASRYLARFDFISTVYVASSEARSLTRLSEQGVAKYALIRVTDSDIKELSQQTNMTQKDFIDSYLIDKRENYGVGIFLVSYKRNEHSMPPVDGKLRELNPDFRWLTVDLQLLVPPPNKGDARPIPFSKVYA